MNAIKATWTNSRIVLAEPVDWPEGSELLVEPITSDEEEIGRKEDDWKDDPESVAAWIAAVERIDPPVWADGEREEYERYRSQRRQANIEAVRKQMEATPDVDAP